jgi:hypothetical protein
MNETVLHMLHMKASYWLPASIPRENFVHMAIQHEHAAFNHHMISQNYLYIDRQACRCFYHSVNNMKSCLRVYFLKVSLLHGCVYIFMQVFVMLVHVP